MGVLHSILPKGPLHTVAVSYGRCVDVDVCLCMCVYVICHVHV